LDDGKYLGLSVSPNTAWKASFDHEHVADGDKGNIDEGSEGLQGVPDKRALMLILRGRRKVGAEQQMQEWQP
jgi:hypothetical protein